MDMDNNVVKAKGGGGGSGCREAKEGWGHPQQCQHYKFLVLIKRK